MLRLVSVARHWGLPYLPTHGAMWVLVAMSDVETYGGLDRRRVRARRWVRLIAVALLCLGCLALFVASIDLHWQAGLLASVASVVAVLIVAVCWASTAAQVQSTALALVEPYLEAGEVVQAVIVATTSEPPSTASVLAVVALVVGVIVVAILVMLASSGGSSSGGGSGGPGKPWWTIVATDHALLMVKFAGRSPVVVKRLPRRTHIGPVSGRWAMISLNGEEMWVRRKYHVEVEAADNAIGRFEMYDRGIGDREIRDAEIAAPPPPPAPRALRPRWRGRGVSLRSRRR